jgi:ribosomal protein S18 acetylase RimI-like enzyme
MPRIEEIGDDVENGHRSSFAEEEEMIFGAQNTHGGERRNLPLDLQFRTILPKDRRQIQQLHEKWFPVVYQLDFYDQLVLGKMCHTGEDLYTNVVCCKGPTADEDEIVACLVGSVVQDTRLNRISRQLLLPDPRRHARLFYIMTLGTVTEYRSLGLASSLIQQCVQNVVNKDPKCGGLYLHVITLNQSAIRFYERLGFWRVQEIPDYYTIDGKNHNCYLYAKYFNGKRKQPTNWYDASAVAHPHPGFLCTGNRGHLGMLQIISWWISSIWKRVKEPLSHLTKSRAYR